MANYRFHLTSTLTPTQAIQSVRPVWLIALGDSWTAFGFHRGFTIPVLAYQSTSFGMFGGNVAQASFYNVPGGMSTTNDPNSPALVEGQRMHGRRGFTAQGHLIDALAMMGYTHATLWEFACGATTINQALDSFGAYAEGLPTRIDPNPGTGQTYGCPPGVIPGGFVGTDGRSMWLQKQLWLNDGSGPANHPYKDWTLCDMAAHAPDGTDVIFVSTLIGNDIHGVAKLYPFVDYFSGEHDPDGHYEAAIEAAAPLAPANETDGGINKIINACLNTLNPGLPNSRREFMWISYENWPVEDERVGVTLTPHRTAAQYAPDAGAELPSYSPSGLPLWRPYSTAEDWWDIFNLNYPPQLVEHNPHTLSPPDPDVGFLPPYVAPYAMPSTIQFPGGATGTNFPWVMNNSLRGFFRVMFAWGPYLAQRDLSYLFLQSWWAHWFADQNAWQRRRGEPSNAYFMWWAGSTYYTYNYTLDNQPWTGYGIPSVPGQWFNNRKWVDIYNNVAGKLNNSGLVNTYVVTTGGAFIDFNKLVTILTKDFTSGNMVKLWRDKIRPRQQATETFWRGLGHNVTFIDVWDEHPTPVEGANTRTSLTGPGVQGGIAIFGDSIANGCAGIAPGPTLTYTTPWATRAHTLAGLPGVVTNCAQDGAHYTTAYGAASKIRDRINTLLPALDAECVVLHAGINDFDLAGAAASAVFNEIQQCVVAAINHGATTVLVGVPSPPKADPRFARSAATNAYTFTERNYLRSLLLTNLEPIFADSPAYVKVLDFDVALDLNGDGWLDDIYNGTYNAGIGQWGDGTHPSANGHEAMAILAEPYLYHAGRPAPTGPIYDYVEGVHLSSYGNFLWCLHIARQIAERSLLLAPTRPKMDLNMALTAEQGRNAYLLNTAAPPALEVNEGGLVPTTYKGFIIPAYEDSADAPVMAKMLVDSGPIARFSSAAVRDVEIPTPLEGWLAWVDDERRLTVFDATLGQWKDALALGGARSWVPSLFSGATALTYNVQHASYLRLGNLILAWWEGVITQNGDPVARLEMTGLPGPPSSTVGVPMIGHATYYAQTVGQRLTCGVELLSSPHRAIFVNDEGTMSLNAGTPQTLNGDTLRGFLIYPAS